MGSQNDPSLCMSIDIDLPSCGLRSAEISLRASASVSIGGIRKVSRSFELLDFHYKHGEILLVSASSLRAETGESRG